MQAGSESAQTEIESYEQAVYDQITGTPPTKLHRWMRMDTHQVGTGRHQIYCELCKEFTKTKGTHYECRDCGARFMHEYDVVISILEAQQQGGVSKNCPTIMSDK